MPAKKTQVKEVTTDLVHLAGAVSHQDGDLVGELLAEWAVSSRHTRRQFAVAVRLAQPNCVRDVQQEAITKYASKVLPPDECCDLILNFPEAHVDDGDAQRRPLPTSTWKAIPPDNECQGERPINYAAQRGACSQCSEAMMPMAS